MVINIWGKKYKKINKYLFYSTAATSRFFPCHDTSVVFIYSCQSRALKYLFALKMEGLDRLLKNASALSKELPRIRSEFNRFFRKKKKCAKLLWARSGAAGKPRQHKQQQTRIPVWGIAHFPWLFNQPFVSTSWVSPVPNQRAWWRSGC